MHHAFGDGGTEDRSASFHGDDGSDHLILIRIFEQVPARACTHGSKDRIIIIEHGDDQHTDIRLHFVDSARGVDAVHAWHFQVHENNVGLEVSSLEKPNHDLTVVSMLHLAEGTQYRLVGANVNGYSSAQPTHPGLEDGYVWLMKNSNQQMEVA